MIFLFILALFTGLLYLGGGFASCAIFLYIVMSLTFLLSSIGVVLIMKSNGYDLESVYGRKKIQEIVDKKYVLGIFLFDLIFALLFSFFGYLIISLLVFFTLNLVSVFLLSVVIGDNHEA